MSCFDVSLNVGCQIIHTSHTLFFAFPPPLCYLWEVKLVNLAAEPAVQCFECAISFCYGDY